MQDGIPRPDKINRGVGPLELAVNALERVAALEKRLAELEKGAITRPDPLKFKFPFYADQHLDLHNQVCWGCNEDDRGFVVVQGCPKHSTEIRERHMPNGGMGVASDDGASGE